MLTAGKGSQRHIAFNVCHLEAVEPAAGRSVLLDFSNEYKRPIKKICNRSHGQQNEMEKLEPIGMVTKLKLISPSALAHSIIYHHL